MLLGSVKSSGCGYPQTFLGKKNATPCKNMASIHPWYSHRCPQNCRRAQTHSVPTPTGRGPSLRSHRWEFCSPSPDPPTFQSSSWFSIASISFPIRNKYIYLIIGSPFEKKTVLCHSIGWEGESRVLDGEKLQVKYFLLSLLLFICKSAQSPAHLFTVAGVFRQGLGSHARRRSRAPAILCQRGTWNRFD